MRWPRVLSPRFARRAADADLHDAARRMRSPVNTPGTAASVTADESKDGVPARSAKALAGDTGIDLGHPPRTPGRHEIVTILDQRTPTGTSAVIEHADESSYVLRLTHAVPLPAQAPVRWFDGKAAWQALADLDRIDTHRVRCQILPPHTWQPAPVRRSTRAPLDASRLLVRIVSSNALAGGRRVATLCLDISAVGCRATWPGQPPRVGDTVDLTWDAGGARDQLELGWVAARVSRLISLPTGASEVCFSFEVTKATQAARIRTWHERWLQQAG
jgi:hypothetical protein